MEEVLEEESCKETEDDVEDVGVGFSHFSLSLLRLRE